MNGNPRVVALGGGHGLAASLRALRLVTSELTAIVTVADDGGSSGRLRGEIGALPPGDLRMALTALAGDDDRSQMWAKLLQHRFHSTGPLDGHAVGNVLLAGLEQLVGDPVVALGLVGELVHSAGCVLPMSVEPLQIVADVAGLDPAQPDRVDEVCGQVAVATTTGQVRTVRLVPAAPAACPAAIAAVDQADWVVFGPGSWFTSVLPHLLVPDLAKALITTTARRLVVLNLVPQLGETSGFSPERHLEVLAEHSPDLQIDVVLADAAAVADVGALRETVTGLGGELVVAPVSVEGPAPIHHPQRLAAAYTDIMGSA
jgi:uncharacterized cofD-like protein